MKRIEGSKETKVYIIDKDFRILYFNKVLKEVFPELEKGQICYQVLCGEDEPCLECPLLKPDKDNSIFYNKKVQKWVEVSTGIVEYPGAEPCNMVFAKEIHEGNKNLFLNLTNINSYDELFEINLTKDNYRVLYQREGKYMVPEPEGKISVMLQEIMTSMFHPDEREAFREFWNLENLFERTNKVSPDEPLAMDFRKKKMDGEYCWIKQIVVPLRYGKNDDKIVMCFIQDIDAQKKREESLKDMIFVRENMLDRLTGLYRKNVFFAKSSEFLRNNPDQKFCLVAIDIEHFKIFNEWYGQDAGDRFLCSIAEHLKKIQEDEEGIAGYVGDDDFAVLIEDDAALMERMQENIMDYVKKYGGNAGFLPAFGIYKIENRNISVNTMYDRALIALDSVKGNYSRRVGWFDEQMMQKMEARHKLLSEVQRALTNEEFTFYGQPKCNMMTGKIIGMESLVRWNHPERGLVPPDEFIPLLEEYGFITNLDLYIWDKVCANLRRWIDTGHRPIPISVNVSRMDLYTLDLADCFSELTDKYHLEPKLIEIEITESAYVEEYGKIRGTVERLRNAGFTVLMDDFGSGYSSLNMLKDVNVDILKIDMKFLEMSEESAERGFSILEAIISMANLIGLRVIAEGVETKNQVDFLLNMGCNYAQGYYFYRPMSIDLFEEFLSDENNVDYRGIMAREVEGFRIKDLLNQNVFSETMMDKILGGVAFYDVFDDKIELIRVNEQYYRVTGSNPVDLEEERKSILNCIYEEDREEARDVFRRADKNLLDGSEGIVRRMRGNGRMMWMKLHAFFLKAQSGHKIYYASLNDITEQKRRELELESSQRALAAVLDVSENDESFMRLSEENRRTAASILAQMAPGGMIGAYCEEGFPLYFANNEMVRLLGYDNYEEFSQAIDGKVINTIHPDDRQRVKEDIGDVYYAGLEYISTYRIQKKDSTWFWVLDKGRVVTSEDNRLAIVGASTDISEAMMAQQQLIQQSIMLLQQNQELKFLNNDIPGGYHRCQDTPDLNFIYISSRFLDIFGYTRKEITELFGDKFIRMVHPEDRIKLLDGMKELSAVNKPLSLEYRMLSKKGYIWVADQSRYIRYRGEVFIQSVLLDITKSVEERNRIDMFFKHTPENIMLVTYKEDDAEFFTLADGLFHELGMPVGSYSNFLNARKHEKMVSDKELKEFRSKREESVKKRENFQSVFHTSTPDGCKVWIKMDCRYVTDNSEGIVYLCIYSDMTQVKQKEEELWIAGKEMESLMDLTDINSWSWDIREHTLTLSGTYRYNPYEESRGSRKVITEFPERAVDKLNVHPDYAGAFMSYIESMQQNMDAHCEEGIFAFRDREGNDIWCKVAGESIRDREGKLKKAVGYYRDITKQRAQELQLIKMAEQDSLTGLQNRQTAIPLIKEYLEEMEDQTAALIMLDMDNFKLANDVFGHAYGDSLITWNAKKLKSFFRSDDILCRIGGDEFLVLCKRIKNCDVEKKLASIIKQLVTVKKSQNSDIVFPRQQDMS